MKNNLGLFNLIIAIFRLILDIVKFFRDKNHRNRHRRRRRR